jgi:hypothetical protein
LTFDLRFAEGWMMNDAPHATRHSATAFALATLTWIWIALAWLGSTDDAAARTLAVGPHRLLKTPSQAAALAADGDRVEIDPGTYVDCAVWRASRLTIEATGPGVVLARRVCAERGIFITVGRNISIRGLTFLRARGRFHNAAGILAVGDDLTVTRSRFFDNENGILAGGSANSVLHVTDSVFHGNGACEGACAHAIYAGGPIRLLDVEHCHFSDTHLGHHVKSRARNTILIGNRIEDGPTGNASYLIELPNGGNALIAGNVLQKGPHSDNPEVAISIGVEGVSNPTAVLIIRNNRFTNDLPTGTVFVRNGTTVPAELQGNVLVGNVVALQGPGVVVR